MTSGRVSRPNPKSYFISWLVHLVSALWGFFLNSIVGDIDLLTRKNAVDHGMSLVGHYYLFLMRCQTQLTGRNFDRS